MVDPNKDRERAPREIRAKGFQGDGYGAPTEYDSGQLTSVIPDGVELKSIRCGKPSSTYKFACVRPRGRDLPKKPRFKDGLPVKP